MDNTTLYLLDDKLQPVSRGQIGELYVSGYNLAAGYVSGRDSEKFVNNPFPSDYGTKKTNARWLENYLALINFPRLGHEKLYRTGDYGKIVDDVLLYEGRTDSQIKIRGQRVDLSEIQAALNNLSVVQKSAVLCYKPGDINQAMLETERTFVSYPARF